MAEYIKREAAIKAVEKADYTAISSDADDCKADYLREIIESVPAADVAPVVHAKWVHLGGDEFCCTNCGSTISDWDLPPQEYCYCLKCGRRWMEVLTMIELKPCPFCGGKARLFVSNGVRVLCPDCGATTRILVDSERVETSAVEDVIKAWNRRASND
jgi:Lar family restriction alleviation protein